MPRDLLYEIGVEEIPAPYVPAAITALGSAVGEQLTSARLSFDSVRALATPRRLAVVVKGLADAQEQLEKVVVGPPARVAYDQDGKPTKAATGFARSQGVDVGELEIVDDYVRVKVLDAGRAASEVVPECLAAATDAITFPKTMRWGVETRFARPIRWLVAMLGSDVLDMEYAGVGAGSATMGLRFWAPGPHAVAGASDYEAVLEKNLVVADHVERRAAILESLRRVASETCGGALVEDDELLDEVTFLVECPTVFAGRFDGRFLKLPRDVTVAAMKGHQRYFAVEKDGTLLPNFLCVANAPPDHIDKIRAGNERVLESRLDDASFYWEEDTRTPLADKVDGLRNVVWLEGLGSLLDKTVRLEKLSLWLAGRLGEADSGTVERAAHLAKADLVTEMVKDGKEFTKLQGAIGREYAAASGESDAVGEAICEHYMPRFAGDSLPSGTAGTILSMADRADSIVGCFSAGLAPTGSQDPYALRRQAIGLVRLIDEKRLSLSLSEFVAAAAAGFGIDGDAASELSGVVLEFIKGRARAFFIDAGYAYDLVDAVLEASLADLAGVRPRLDALTHFRENESFKGLVIGIRRVSNILKDQPRFPHDPGALIEPSAVALETERARVAGEVESAIARSDFEGAVVGLLSLRGTIDTFFDDVMVMVDDAKLREARLGLLSAVRDLFLEVADFARVVLEGEDAQ